MKLQKKHIGKRLQTRRKEMGFRSQSDLAEVIGADQPTVARWETGVYFPSDEYIEKLKAALDVDNSFFFLEDDGTSHAGEVRETSKADPDREGPEVTLLLELLNRVDHLEQGLKKADSPLVGVNDSQLKTAYELKSENLALKIKNRELMSELNVLKKNLDSLSAMPEEVVALLKDILSESPGEAKGLLEAIQIKMFANREKTRRAQEKAMAPASNSKRR